MLWKTILMQAECTTDYFQAFLRISRSCDVPRENHRNGRKNKFDFFLCPITRYIYRRRLVRGKHLLEESDMSSIEKRTENTLSRSLQSFKMRDMKDMYLVLEGTTIHSELIICLSCLLSHSWPPKDMKVYTCKTTAKGERKLWLSGTHRSRSFFN